jgi:predicted RNA binding protein YcfA (HicA-like mRNA interferase family)
LKLPRDASGRDLVRALERLGYAVVRQEGSHVRLTHPGPPEHHVTVPDYDPLRVGMLGAIVKDVSRFTGASLERILELP